MQVGATVIGAEIRKRWVSWNFWSDTLGRGINSIHCYEINIKKDCDLLCPTCLRDGKLSVENHGRNVLLLS